MSDPGLDVLLDGAVLAVDNAERLLTSALGISDSDPGTASFLVVTAWEEMGKAIRLGSRASDAFQNEAVEIDAELFNVPEVVDILVRDLKEFGAFVKSPLRSHYDKLAAFSEHFDRPRAVRVDGDEVTLARVDLFRGRSPEDIVLMSRRSVLVDFFTEDTSFKAPLPMFESPRGVAQFHLEHEIPKVRESVEAIRKRLAESTPTYSERKRILEESKDRAQA